MFVGIGYPIAVIFSCCLVLYIFVFSDLIVSSAVVVYGFLIDLQGEEAKFQLTFIKHVNSKKRIKKVELRWGSFLEKERFCLGLRAVFHLL